MRELKGTSLRLMVFFVLLSGIPLALLGWFGWRVLEQERALETQRLKERLDNAAGLIAQELDHEITVRESLLAKAGEGLDEIPPDSAFIVFNPEGVIQHGGIHLAYYPRVSTPAPESVTAAEIDEFRDGNCSRATESYRKLAASHDRATRANGLVRLARCFRKVDATQEALAVYEELAGLADTPAAGDPAELVAHFERIALFKQIRDSRSQKQETALLRKALSSGRFAIDRSTFTFYAEALDEPLPAPPSLQLARAMEDLWPQLEQQPAGRKVWKGKDASIVAVWRQVPNGTAALLADADSLIQPARRLLSSLQVQLAFDDFSQDKGISTIRTSRETGLPWTIRVSPIDGTAVETAWRSRRNLLLAGFALIACVIAAASYAVFRAVSHEVGVARLQSDFVAAVSHEFRTPLTAMRHLTEMLEEGNVGSDRAMHYYQALGRETRRLHEMVENLLDFGRLESGRHTYHMEETSAVELARRVVGEFRDRGTNRLELAGETFEPADGRIRGDRQALSLALRNLLDNAIKYSPESSVVEIGIECRDGFAGISVQDHGAGIPKDEQRAVFRKFVRGAAARSLNVKGTGIGLTMADQIVRAHGGHLELASEPGHGTRFTILLPLLDEKS
jgi:signal transduction histidine kinase